MKVGLSSSLWRNAPSTTTTCSRVSSSTRVLAVFTECEGPNRFPEHKYLGWNRGSWKKTKLCVSCETSGLFILLKFFLINSEDLTIFLHITALRVMQICSIQHFMSENIYHIMCCLTCFGDKRKFGNLVL